jgi:hypothetical protein
MLMLYPKRPSRVSRVFSRIRPLIINLGLVGICQGHCLILFVYIGDSADVGGVLTFYIPSVLDD